MAVGEVWILDVDRGSWRMVRLEYTCSFIRHTCNRLLLTSMSCTLIILCVTKLLYSSFVHSLYANVAEHTHGKAKLVNLFFHPLKLWKLTVDSNSQTTQMSSSQCCLERHASIYCRWFGKTNHTFKLQWYSLSLRIRSLILLQISHTHGHISTTVAQKEVKIKMHKSGSGKCLYYMNHGFTVYYALDFHHWKFLQLIMPLPCSLERYQPQTG